MLTKASHFLSLSHALPPRRSSRSDAAMLGVGVAAVHVSDTGGAVEPATPPSNRASRDDARPPHDETVMDILLEMADTFSDFAVPEDGSRSGPPSDSGASYGYSTTRGQYLQRMLVAGGVSRGNRLLRVNHAATAARGVLLVEAGMNPVRTTGPASLPHVSARAHLTNVQARTLTLPLVASAPPQSPEKAALRDPTYGDVDYVPRPTWTYALSQQPGRLATWLINYWTVRARRSSEQLVGG